MATTISTHDIRDKAITSSKLDTNILVSGDLTLGSPRLIIPTASSYFLTVDTNNTIKSLLTRSICVSNTVDDLSKMPEKTASAYIKGDLKIEGDLELKGALRVTSTETIELSDNIILLNSNLSKGVAPSKDAGLEINRGNQPNSQIIWDENNDYWAVSSDTSIYSRIIDKTYGDSIYTKNSGDTMTGPLIISKSMDGVMLGLYSVNGNSSFRIGSDQTQSSFDFKYTGSEQGLNKSLELWTDGTGSSGATKVFRVQQDGIMRIQNSLSVLSDIEMVAGKKVDGVDISEHNENKLVNIKHVTDAYLGALAGTTGTPSVSNKYVTNTDPRLTDGRTALTHGDTSHNKLSYFDTVVVGAGSKSATANIRKLNFVGAKGATVALTNNASNDAIITITAEDHFLKLDSSTEQLVKGDLKVNNNMVVVGDLEVKGALRVTNTETIELSDNIVLLNSNLLVTATPTQNSGFEINRGNQKNTSILWDEASKFWTLTNNGTNYYRVMDKPYSDSLYASIGDQTVRLSGDITGSTTRTNNGAGTWDVDTELDTIKMHFNPTFIDNFNKDSRTAWATSGLTMDVPRDGVVRLTSTNTNSQLIKSGLSISGSINKYLLIRYKYISGTVTPGEVYYTTSNHSYADTFKNNFTLKNDGEWHTLTLDMHLLSVGGSDWATSTITGIRFDPTSSTGSVFDIDFIAVGSVGYGGNYISDNFSIEGETTSNGIINAQSGIKIFSGTTLMGEINATETTWLRINNAVDKNIYTPRGIRADRGITSGNYLLATNEVRSDIFRGANSAYYTRPDNTTIAGLFAGKVGIGNLVPSEMLEVTGAVKSSLGYKVNGTEVINSILDHAGRNATFTGALTTTGLTKLNGTADIGMVSIGGNSSAKPSVYISSAETYGTIVRMNNTAAGGGDYSLVVTNNAWTAGAERLLFTYGMPNSSTSIASMDKLGNFTARDFTGINGNFSNRIGVGTVTPDEAIHAVGKIKADEGFTTGQSTIEYDPMSKTLNFNFID